MACPECNAPVEAGSTYCAKCGLLLIGASEPPKRRREDLAVERRRATDAVESTECPFCRGAIEATAVRCLHCRQIVNEEFRKNILRRRRSQINYASWVAYIFGLLVFLIFQPVGLLMVAIGLMLSVLYYAIPADDLPGEKRSFWQTFKRQLKFERTAIPFPHMHRRKFIVVGTPVVAAIAGFLANFVLLQKPMNDVLSQNPAFAGITVSAHYQYWIVPGVVVYDLREVSRGATPLHVQTALLEYASSLRGRDFDRVELQYRGDEKFWLDGEAFRKLGEEYEKRNFEFVLLDFPRLIRSDRKIPEIVDQTDAREALVAFHRIWYGYDSGMENEKR